MHTYILTAKFEIQIPLERIIAESHAEANQKAKNSLEYKQIFKELEHKYGILHHWIDTYCIGEDNG